MKFEHDQVYRGDIYYIKPAYTEENTGSVARNKCGRPAIIVSNDDNNLYSSVVEIVYLTTKPKKGLPTHVKINETGQESTVLCEQIYSVDKSRLGDYVGHIYYEDMQPINQALSISIGLAH